MILDDENIDLYVSVEGNSETTDDTLKEEKKTRKHGLLNWLKLRVCTVWIYVYFSSFFDRYQASVFDNLNTSHNLAFSLIVVILSILFIYFVFSILFDLIVKKKKK